MNQPSAGGTRERADRIRLWLLVVAALIVRVVVASRLRLVEVDGAYWCGLAESLAHGDLAHGLSAAWPPLYPAAIAAAARVLEALGRPTTPATFEWAARLVSCAAGALLLLPLASLARRLTPATVGSVLLIAAVHPRLIEYSSSALSESLFTLALVMGLAALASAESEAVRGTTARLAAAGAGFGLAFLVRPEGLPLGLAMWAAAAARRPVTGGSRLRPAFLVAILIVALPWLAFLHARTGSWTLGEKGPYNFWRTHRTEYARHFPAPRALPARVNRSPELAPPAEPRELHLAEFVMREPVAVIARSAKQLGVLVASSLPVTAGWPVALLALLGAFATRSGPWGIVAAPLIAVPLLIAPFGVDRRFLVPLVPLLILAAGLALAEVRRRGGARLATWVTASLTLGLLIYAAGVPDRADRAPEQRAAGEWLAREWPSATGGVRDSGDVRRVAPHAPRHGPVVMARKPWAAFYAGGLIADLPDASPDSILADARRSGVDVLVVDARSAHADRPQLAAWLDPGRAPRGWRLLYRGPGSDPILLYTRAEELMAARDSGARPR